MRKASILFLCSILFSLTACNEEYPELENGMYAEFQTTHGTFVAELFYEATPMTVASFVSLAEGTSEMTDSLNQGKEFYDGLKFHRVIKDFMIQGGDPTGTGSGGPGYKFPNEIVDSLQHDSAGILSMANSGPDTNGSQFFITLKETPWLDGIHTVFGEVVMSMDVVEAIGSVETAAGDKPVDDVVMKEVNIIRKGSDAKNFNAAEVLKSELQQYEEELAAQEEKMTSQIKANAQRFEERKAEANELESGLKIYYIEDVEGQKPVAGDTLLVNYTGYLSTGEIFDTNIEELSKEYGLFNQKRKAMNGYSPMPVEVGPGARVIPGFREGVEQLNPGDKAILFIPAHLGYGERGASPVIPPNADLIFEVEAVEAQ
ncbi:peptidylprolyl isomerase [Salinimicrobium sp. GXAS 041]|uniref:peptidylprolyl isomerase n=1 Tax=Salinimicrobium sp. GXAS 041 TaxID=3400806 RepID=UPI003C76CBE7